MDHEPDEAPQSKRSKPEKPDSPAPEDTGQKSTPTGADSPDKEPTPIARSEDSLPRPPSESEADTGSDSKTEDTDSVPGDGGESDDERPEVKEMGADEDLDPHRDFEKLQASEGDEHTHEGQHDEGGWDHDHHQYGEEHYHEQEEDPYHHEHGYEEEEEGEEETPGEEVSIWGDEDGEGGPIKSFLDHLEDLRWTIIRCAAALLIGMVLCLVAGNKVVELLKEPLKDAQRLRGKTKNHFVVVQSGTNLVTVTLETNRFGALDLGTNQALKLVMEPSLDGTNLVLGLRPEVLRPEEIPPALQIELINLGPISPFVVALKIALFGGIGLASPFILFFIGQFVVPALRKNERRYLYYALAIGSGLFCAGVAFCYFFMVKVALNAAVKFSQWMNFGAEQWRAEEYIGFVVKFLLGMGLSFELPVVLLTLVKLDLLDYPRMKKFRPYWVIVNLVLASLLTPPDVISQLLMAVPLQVLYEVSVFIAWMWYRKDQKRLAEEEAAAE